MTIEQLRGRLTVAKIQYKAAVAALDDWGILYYGKKMKRLSAQIAKLTTNSAP